MPLDVGSQLESSPHIRAVTPAVINYTSALETSTGSLARIQGEVGRECAELKIMFQDVPEEVLDTVLGIVYGPFMLSREALTAEKLSDVREKEASARIEQGLVHSIFQASEPDADPEFASHIYQAVRLGHRLSMARPLMEGTKIRLIWKGIQNQLAIVRALKAGGYDVYLPDYSQDSLSIADNKNEVLQLDVKNGVDLVARRFDGMTIMVDAKGRIDKDSVSLDGSRHVDLAYEWSPLVRDVVGSFRPTSLFRTTIMIPTTATSFVAPTFVSKPEDPRKQLSDVGRLKSFNERAIIDAVDRLPITAAPVNRRFR